MTDDATFRDVTDGHAIGVAMRLTRRRLGMSQRALAEALGWDRAKVGRWESGEVPDGFDQVVGLLRNLGFGLELTDLRAPGWGDIDEPAEHLADRGRRRFPAHLELCEENTISTYNWSRHRSEPSPGAGLASFRRRTQVDAAADPAGFRVPRRAVRAKTKPRVGETDAPPNPSEAS